LRRRRRRL
jgi:hypothetical protein